MEVGPTRAGAGTRSAWRFSVRRGRSSGRSASLFGHVLSGTVAQEGSSEVSDHLAAVGRTQPPPDIDVDGLAHEADAAVTHRDVDAAGVAAAGGQDIPGAAVVHARQ